MFKKIVIISGPTASGKSDLALKLSDFCDIAIINADSLQVYEGLQILSSQPSNNEKKRAPHLLYSCLKWHESSSIVNWFKLLEVAVKQAEKEKRIPVIVGGSGMYISKLIEGISRIPLIDNNVKEQALQLYEKIGHDEFKKKVNEEKIIDRQRLIRAYEVLLQTGKPISFWQKESKEKLFPDAKFLHINLNPGREQLYIDCNLRFKKMLNIGALDEVEYLVKQGVTEDKQITKTLGFYEIRDFLINKLSREKMIEVATQKTRNYAKRQLTWFRNQLPDKHIFKDKGSALSFLKDEI